MRTFFLSLKYSFRLLYKSSKLLFVVYLLLQIACSITPIISTFLLKDLLDSLVSSEPVMRYVWLYIGSIGVMMKTVKLYGLMLRMLYHGTMFQS